jgi:hypothetical protein
MGNDTSQLLEQSSQISTHFQCDNCGVTIDQTSWLQCKICKMFDLCGSCANLEYSKLLTRALHEHQQLHTSTGENELIFADCLESITIDVAEKYAEENPGTRREEADQYIINAQQIKNDYELSLAMGILKGMENTSSSSEVDDKKRTQLFKMIADYHIQAYERNIRVLSLDGGG